jgi:integrase
MALTDTQIRNTKPQDKPQKLFDGGGLHLLVTTTGSKLWRIKYRIGGKEKLLALGAYPDISLADARDRRADVRKQLAQGVDPSSVKRLEKIKAKLQAADTFGALADEWLDTKCKDKAPATIKQNKSILKNHLRPWLGSRPVKEITAPELLAVLRRIESKGTLELAHRSLRLAGQIFRYGIATGRAERSPASDLHGALTPVVTKHHPAITNPVKVGELLRAIDGYSGFPVVLAALRLAPLVFVRPGELRAAKWADIDLEVGEWRFHITKTKTDHIVPLSSQATALLRELHLLTGRGEYVFPSIRTAERPMSENTVNAALRRLGYSSDEMVGHGFRAIARTILDEELGVRVDLIEHQLGHEVKDPNGRAYNRTSFLVERKLMMQQWADYLDKLKVGAEVIELKPTKTGS